MIDQNIINKWLDAKSDEALKKLLNNEPLTFEDDVVFCLVGQREETHGLRGDMTKLETSLRGDMTKLEANMTKLETSLRGDMTKLEANMTKLENSLRGDMTKLETSLRGDMTKLEASMTKLERNLDERMNRFEKSIEQRLSLVEDQITDVKIELREVKSELSAMNRRFDDVRKDMIVQTRWTIAVVTLLTVVVKLVDIFVK